VTPADFVRALWGISPCGFIQLWRLADRRSFYMRATSGVDYYAQGQPDVYTGVALAGQDHGRYNRAKANQAVAIPGLWLDIDVKAGAANDLDDALTLATAVAQPTLIVNSGYGIHAWHLFDRPWRFADMDDQAKAADLAARWTALHRGIALEQGFSIDHTHDLARLLRLPGTINAKGGHEAAVTVHTADGPRHRRLDLAKLCADVAPDLLPGTSTGASGDLPQVDIGPARALAAEVLDALLDNSPEFKGTWTHARGKRAEHWSLSEYDLALCSIAAQAGLTDQQLADLIALHRRTWDPTDEKGQRRDYVQRTVAKARQSAQRAGDIDYFRRMARPAEAAA